MTESWLNNASLDGELVGRETSFLSSDMQEFSGQLSELIEGSKILFIGAAGSIGLHTLKTVLRFKPKTVHVIDHNENGLAEVVRTLRSGTDPIGDVDLALYPFDFGGRPFNQWLKAQSDGYDYILNFAALKHVRSEKDPYSILAMLETNVLKLQRLSEQFDGQSSVKRMFCVSTDKAANPSSMMGATKRLMEHALFGQGRRWHPGTQITSARFANVALSNGSLLQSWKMRMSQDQPMACPEDCSRYFVTLSEAGHLCTLGALLGEGDSILVPKLDPEEHLVTLQSVATIFLRHAGYAPHFLTDENEARQSVERLAKDGKWPVLLTPLNTAGEKPYEEFVGADETELPTNFGGLNRVPYLQAHDPERFTVFIDRINEMLNNDSADAVVSLEQIKDEICEIEEAFRKTHVVSKNSLDQRV